MTTPARLVIPPMIATAKPFSPRISPIAARAWVTGATRMPAAPPSAAASANENADMALTLMPISPAAVRSKETACIARPISVLRCIQPKPNIRTRATAGISNSCGYTPAPNIEIACATPGEEGRGKIRQISW